MESTSNCPKRRSRFIGGLAALSALVIAAPVFAGVPCTGDLNGDGGVDTVDLGILLGDFGCTPVYGGPCAIANPNGDGTPGCSADLACEAIVCADDPFCCDTAWDGLCATGAQELCAPTNTCVGDINEDGAVDTTDLGILLGDFGCTPELFCGSQFAGSCCEANGTPFCNDGTCCELICADDPFCCATEWDGLCASQAIDQCVDCFACGSTESGSCCEANGTPYCDNAQCCETVCAQDPFCCETEWDGLCASDAADLCGPLCVVTGACCLGDGTCQEGTEEQCINNEGTYQGDGTTCADVDCPQPLSCGDANAGDCCVNNGTPFCNDAACCEAVCAGDPFCCDTLWDGLCASDANAVCTVCGVAPACGVAGTGSCCENNGTPFCNDAACCETVCGLDPFCCDSTWDGICADQAATECGTLCAP